MSHTAMQQTDPVEAVQSFRTDFVQQLFLCEQVGFWSVILPLVRRQICAEKPFANAYERRSLGSTDESVCLHFADVASWQKLILLR